MHYFLYHYIELATIFLALGATFIIAYRAWQNTHKTTRLGILPFQFLGQVMIITCMFIHLFEIIYHSFESGFTGKFSILFYFYSLVLLGLVEAIHTLLLLRQSHQ